MNFVTIDYEVADRVATITFNRPDQLNALSPEMIRELRQAYAAAEADDNVWLPSSPARAGRSAPGRTSRRSPMTAGSSTTSPTFRRTRNGRRRRRAPRRFAR